ncbi:MAG: hypothetical protein KAH44_16265, partial [Oricola sp.]|nr:hypothetical protein [Oricola sp.]
MLSYIRWRDAVEAQEKAAAGLQEISALIEETVRVAAAASAAQTNAHEALDPLRLSEAEAAAALHRLTVAREGLDEEARRAEAELTRLSNEIERLKNDMAREKDLLADADNAVEALSGEEEALRAREAAEADHVAAAETAKQEAAAALEAAEALFDQKSKEAADIEARRKASSNNLAAAERRLEKIAEQIRSYTDERQLVEPTPEQATALEAAKVKFAAAEEAANAAEAAFQRAEEERNAAEAREAELRGPLRRAEQSLTELDAEREALRRVLAANESEDWTPLIEMIEVDAGYENALAAALGDDLGAAVDEGAPAHWSHLGETAAEMSLPEGVS